MRTATKTSASTLFSNMDLKVGPACVCSLVALISRLLCQAVPVRRHRRKLANIQPATLLRLYTPLVASALVHTVDVPGA